MMIDIIIVNMLELLLLKTLVIFLLMVRKNWKMRVLKLHIIVKECFELQNTLAIVFLRCLEPLNTLANYHSIGAGMPNQLQVNTDRHISEYAWVTKNVSDDCSMVRRRVLKWRNKRGSLWKYAYSTAVTRLLSISQDIWAYL